MIDINELRSDANTAYFGHMPLEISGSDILEVLDRLSAAEKERDDLKAKIEQMERHEPVGIVHAMPGAGAFTMACFDAQDIPVGTKLYALLGVKGEEK